MRTCYSLEVLRVCAQREPSFLRATAGHTFPKHTAGHTHQEDKPHTVVVPCPHHRDAPLADRYPVSGDGDGPPAVRDPHVHIQYWIPPALSSPTSIEVVSHTQRVLGVGPTVVHTV